MIRVAALAVWAFVVLSVAMRAMSGDPGGDAWIFAFFAVAAITGAVLGWTA